MEENIPVSKYNLVHFADVIMIISKALSPEDNEQIEGTGVPFYISLKR